MDHPPDVCLDRKTVRRYLTDDLTQQEDLKVRNHLDSCSKCHDRAVELLKAMESGSDGGSSTDGDWN